MKYTSPCNYFSVTELETDTFSSLGNMTLNWMGFVDDTINYIEDGRLTPFCKTKQFLSPDTI